MNEADFQFYKFAALCISFSMVVILQVFFPYGSSLGEVLRNTRTNLSLAGINAVLMQLICAGCVCFLAGWAETREIGATASLGLPSTTRIIVTVFALDLVAYLWHWANHRHRLLWRFHSVHHSDTILDASTAFRFHPGELLISLSVRIVAVIGLGLPVLGILLFEIIYGFCNSLEHGHTRLNRDLEKILAKVFITPATHRKHHSQNRHHLDHNFGTIFIFWDRIFGTFLPSVEEHIAVGLPRREQVSGNLVQLLLLPLKPTSQRVPYEPL